MRRPNFWCFLKIFDKNIKIWLWDVVLWISCVFTETKWTAPFTNLRQIASPKSGALKGLLGLLEIRVGGRAGVGKSFSLVIQDRKEASYGGVPRTKTGDSRDNEKNRKKIGGNETNRVRTIRDLGKKRNLSVSWQVAYEFWKFYFPSCPKSISHRSPMPYRPSWPDFVSVQPGLGENLERIHHVVSIFVQPSGQYTPSESNQINVNASFFYSTQSENYGVQWWERYDYSRLVQPVVFYQIRKIWKWTKRALIPRIEFRRPTIRPNEKIHTT